MNGPQSNLPGDDFSDDLPIPGYQRQREESAEPRQEPAYGLALSAIALWWAALAFAWLFQRLIRPLLREVGGGELPAMARISASVTSPELWFTILLVIAGLLAAVALLFLANWESRHRAKAFVIVMCLCGLIVLWFALSFVVPLLSVAGKLQTG